MSRKSEPVPYTKPEQVAEAYERYADTIYRLSFFYLKNGADAEDAVQTAFLRLFSTNPVFREEEHRKAWLLKTAANCCRDMLRARKVSPEPPEFMAQRLAEEERKDPAAAAPGENTVLEALLALPEEYKAPLYLHYYEGFPCKEIAQMLGKKNATIRSLMLRGRRKLKEYLEGGAV